MAIPRRKLVDRNVQQRGARLFLIVTEGARTEPNYFRAVEDARLIPVERMKLHVVPPDDGATAPKHLLGRAETAQRAVQPWQPDDEVWLVFDVDAQSGSNRLDQVRETAQDAMRRGWQVAVSNPCFEVWFLLHAPGERQPAPLHPSDIVDALRRAFGQYNKMHVPTRCLDAAALAEAITHGRAMDVDADAPIPAHGVTRVYRLMAEMRALARP